MFFFCVCHCRRCWSPSPVYVATATWLWHHREAHQAFGQLLPGGNPQDWCLPVWGGHQTRSMSSPGQQVTHWFEQFFCFVFSCVLLSSARAWFYERARADAIFTSDSVSCYMDPSCIEWYLSSSDTFCREVVDSMVKHFKVTIFGDCLPVYDGKKSLYTANPLPVASGGVRFTVNFRSFFSA